MAANTATMVIYCRCEDALRILLGKRDSKKSADAYPGYWCLPGGFLNVGTERLIDAASRETEEEVGLKISRDNWQLFHMDDNPGDDPRYTQVANSCFFTRVLPEDMSKVIPGDDLEDARWFTMHELMEVDFAFNHAEIVTVFCNLFINANIA
jgi:8-oxo-dGTP diphosphatase